MNRLVALIALTAAFAPAAVLGALPMVSSIVLVPMIVWIIVTARASAHDRAVEPPVTPTR